MKLLLGLLYSRALTAVIDILVLHAAMYMTFFIRFGGDIPSQNWDSYVSIFPYMAVALVTLFLAYDQYSSQLRPWNEIVMSTAISVALLSLFSVAFSFFSRAFAFPRTVILLSIPIQFLLLLLWRHFHLMGLKHCALPRRVLVIGHTEEEAETLADKVHHQEGLKTGQITIDGLDQSADVEQRIVGGKLDKVYIGGSVHPDLRRQLAEQCVQHGVGVALVPGFYEIVLSQARVTQVDDTPLLEVQRLVPSSSSQAVKRTVDILTSGLGLIAALPIMAMVACLIYLDCPGPALFRQVRVAQNGRPFTLYKFRTMVVDAEMYTGPVLATANDPRITRIGRFLRATRLDELPQLFNVLGGDMSLVGPRPERPMFVDAFSQEMPWYEQRLCVKPGLTGLAQVSGRYSTAFEDKLRYDILYVTSQSLLNDLRIIFKTIRTVLQKEKSL